MTGDIYVYVMGGTYGITSTITFGVQDSGTNGHRIYYEAYPGSTAILNGATKVTGWTLSTGNIYKATLNRTTKLRNLYVNDARASMTSKTVNSGGVTILTRSLQAKPVGPGLAVAVATESSTAPTMFRLSQAIKTI